jgi:hypothetical protein
MAKNPDARKDPKVMKTLELAVRNVEAANTQLSKAMDDVGKQGLKSKVIQAPGADPAVMRRKELEEEKRTARMRATNERADAREKARKEAKRQTESGEGRSKAAIDREIMDVIQETKGAKGIKANQLRQRLAALKAERREPGKTKVANSPLPQRRPEEDVRRPGGKLIGTSPRNMSIDGLKELKKEAADYKKQFANRSNEEMIGKVLKTYESRIAAQEKFIRDNYGDE